MTINGWIDEDGDPVTSAVLRKTDAPVENRKETSLSKHQKTWESAWWHSGANLKEGVPFLSRKDMITFFVEQRGLSDSSAKNYIKPSQENKPICELLNGGVIGVSDDGWIMLDKTHLSALMIAKNGRQWTNGT